MGDRTISTIPCPQCGKDSELYDAPSSLMYEHSCSHCNYRDPREYFEVDAHNIILCTPEEARTCGGLVICPKCTKEVMGSYLTATGCMECEKPVTKMINVCPVDPSELDQCDSCQ